MKTKKDVIAEIVISICVLVMLIFLAKTFYHHDSGITELYFEDHGHLPYNISVGEDYAFSFTVQNMENQTIEYQYSIMAEVEGKEPALLKEDGFLLKKGHYKTAEEHFMINDSFESAKIIVRLDYCGQSEEIFFYVVNFIYH